MLVYVPHYERSQEALIKRKKVNVHLGDVKTKPYSVYSSERFLKGGISNDVDDSSDRVWCTMGAEIEGDSARREGLMNSFWTENLVKLKYLLGDLILNKLYTPVKNLQ